MTPCCFPSTSCAHHLQPHLTGLPSPQCLHSAPIPTSDALLQCPLLGLTHTQGIAASVLLPCEFMSPLSRDFVCVRCSLHAGYVTWVLFGATSSSLPGWRVGWWWGYWFASSWPEGRRKGQARGRVPVHAAHTPPS